MQMFVSIAFAAAGVMGAMNSLSVAAVGLANGPLCYWSNKDHPIPKWGTPFANRYKQFLWTDVLNIFTVMRIVFI